MISSRCFYHVEIIECSPGFCPYDFSNPARSSHQLAAHFGVKQSAASALCQLRAEEGLLVVADATNEARSYRLADASQQTFYK
jgi:hypothetical protein